MIVRSSWRRFLQYAPTWRSLFFLFGYLFHGYISKSTFRSICRSVALVLLHLGDEPDTVSFDTAIQTIQAQESIRPPPQSASVVIGPMCAPLSIEAPQSAPSMSHSVSNSSMHSRVSSIQSASSSSSVSTAPSSITLVETSTTDHKKVGKSSTSHNGPLHARPQMVSRSSASAQSIKEEAKPAKTPKKVIAGLIVLKIILLFKKPDPVWVRRRAEWDARDARELARQRQQAEIRAAIPLSG